MSARNTGEEWVGVQSQSGQTVQRAGALGAVIALGAGVLFAVTAVGANSVARFGGAAWVFILTWIILMPVLAPWLKQRQGP